MNTFIQFIVMLVSIPVGILRAWVLLSMWRWFVVPTFDLPDLTLGIAYALLLIVAIGKNYGKFVNKDLDKEEVTALQVSSLLINLIMILFTWLVAWIVYLII